MTSTTNPSAAPNADFEQQWQEWRREQEIRRADPHGFLAITSMNWLTEEPQRFEDAPGEWFADADGVHVELADGEAIVIDGAARTGRYDFEQIPIRGAIMAAWNDAVLEVGERAGRFMVRPRHPDAPVVTGYKGTPTFDPDPRWSVQGTFIPFESIQPIPVDTIIEGLEVVYHSPGRVEFELDGTPTSLTLFGEPSGPYMALFTDGTSGITTYGANRTLMIDPADADGQVTLDFNRAVNMPCAYIDLATCPLPPAENRLSIPIEAGEKIPA